ncbi:hypothetical protein TMEN_4553 [Trichophyton mentagrophytes]|nr:hypothetical protein TMEN_4553 [Trichophyton mentagrophytes]
MPVSVFHCIICGYWIESFAAENWLREFRIIYRSAKGAFISGAGCYSNPFRGEWIAPSDSTLRWDSLRYISSPSDRIPVMRQSEEGGRHGFVMHDLCWQLLRKFYAPDDVPIKRLLDVCKSLPLALQGSCAFWGHDYGGLLTLDTRDHYSWENGMEENFNNGPADATVDPYDVAEISEFLTMSHNLSSSLGTSQPRLARERKEDCFAIFPWELIEEISANLLISDILALVCASRTFGPILSSQTFWASRFEPGRDRDFLFEKRKCKEARDWIRLYQLTNRSVNPPGLKNRRRIWNLIQKLAPYLGASLDKSLSNSPLTPSHHWICEVAGDIQVESVTRARDTFHQGCLLFDRQCATIPSNLSSIGFSIAEDSITGIRLVTSTQEDIRLGYIIKSKEALLETTSLFGFILAVDSRGIRAVRVIYGNGSKSDWIGNPADTPITERLMKVGDINALEVGVDGYKIISIATASSHPAPFGMLLRSKAFWYPSIPSPELCLNDQSFSGKDPLTAGYHPLAWIHFGGPKGAYLKHVTGVRAMDIADVCTFEFEYEIDLPVEIRKLGRRKVLEFSTTTRFNIDGPGGEYISSVDACVISGKGKDMHPCRRGRLFSIKFTTNHGRSAHFPARCSIVDPGFMTPLSVEPGTIVTGLYGAQHPERGLISLGVISEVVTHPRA